MFLPTGKMDEAIYQYKEALRLSPFYADAHNNYAITLARSAGMMKRLPISRKRSG